MAEPDDILSREVAIALKWDASSASLNARSRALSGIDRLLGSLADLPAAFLEGIAGKKRLRDAIEERLMVAQANVAERVLNGSATSGDAMLLGILKKEARRQANAGAVAIEALENLKALPPPSQPAQGPADAGPEKLDEDWLNQFTRYAEDASSDDLQQLWGRVLAGETRQPGSFSRHALRFVAELDKQTALNCEYAAERTVGNIIPADDNWRRGIGLAVGVDLQRLGLLEGLGSGTMGNNYTIGPDGHILLQKGKHALVIFGKPSASVRAETILVTRLGMEVFSLLSPQNETIGLRQLAQLLGKAPFERIELGRASAISDNEANFECDEVLWQAPA